MKKECEIVKDLLPLYAKKQCSSASRKYVEEHMMTCETCHQISMSLEKFEAETKQKEHEDIDRIEKIGRRWKQERIVSMLRGAAIVAFIASLTSLYAYQKIGSYVDAEGFLQEPFYLVGFFYIFLMIAILMGIIALTISKKKKSGKRR